MKKSDPRHRNMGVTYALKHAWLILLLDRGVIYTVIYTALSYMPQKTTMRAA